MESSAAKRETTINAQLVGVLPGDLPKVNLLIHASGRNGTKRHFTRQVSIPDSALFARLKQESGVGDYLRATVVSEYRETGSVTYLTDFSQVPDVELTPIVRKRAVDTAPSDVVQITTTQTTLPSVRDPKTKIKY
jgi:hypothetical protein